MRVVRIVCYGLCCCLASPLLQSCSYGIATPTIETKSALEMQAMQVREFNCTKEQGLTAIISMFQDLGYTVEQIESTAGLVMAKTPSKATWVLGRGAVTKWAKATGFVEPISDGRTRIRLSFVNSEMVDGYHMQSTNEARVEDPNFYQNAFALLHKAIFVRSNTQ